MNWYTTSGWLAPADDGIARRIEYLNDELRLVQAALKCSTNATRKHNLRLQRDCIEAKIKHLQEHQSANDDTAVDG